MRAQTTLCPESEDVEEKEDHDRIRDPHGENLHWAKRTRLENKSGVKATSL
jgi:hypothetical protein